jgi:hypothetical protein
MLRIHEPSSILSAIPAIDEKDSAAWARLRTSISSSDQHFLFRRNQPQRPARPLHSENARDRNQFLGASIAPTATTSRRSSITP